MTASAHPDRVALRTKDDEFTSTAGREYAEQGASRWRRARGARRWSAATRSALMLTNRPEFHFADTAAMHLGATPFSIYNTYSPEQIEYLVGDAARPIIVTEQAFLDRILAVKEACGSLEHVIVVDGDAPDGALTLDELVATRRRRLRLRGGLARRRAGRRAHADLHLGHDRAAEGRAAHARQPGRRRCARYDEMIAVPRRRRASSRTCRWRTSPSATAATTCRCVLGFTVTCCPNPREVVGYLPEVRPTWFFAVPRIWEKLKAALEAGIEAEQDAEQQAGAPQWALDVGLQQGAARAGRRGGPRRAARRSTRRRTSWCSRRSARHARPRRGRGRCNVGRRAHAARGDRVLPRDRACRWPSCGACPRPAAPAPATRPSEIKIGTVGPAGARASRSSSPSDGEVLIRGPVVMKGYRNAPGEDGGDDRPPTAGCTPATSASSTTTAT